MKRIIALLAVAALLLVPFACTAVEEGPRFVTIQEWLDAKGDCGDCMLLLKIRQVLNPVLAVGADETGEVNLYSGGEFDLILVFGDEEGTLDGYWMVIANPRYNLYEDTVEMADWTVLRLIPDLP